MIMAEKNFTKWKEVTIGGFTGILLGSAGTLFASNVHKFSNPENINDIQNEDTQNEEDPSTETVESNSNTLSGDIPSSGVLANNVNDEMSFSQAFSAARDEVGAGGYFVWHGNVYGTYYASEWNSMTHDEQVQFSLGSSNIPQTEYSHSENITTSEASYTTTSNNETLSSDSSDGDDFQILGVEHANIDGEHDSIIGAASVNGQAVYFIDVDGQDNEFEYMVADANANNQIEDNEFIDISEQHIQVSAFEEIAQANNPQNEIDQYYASNEDLPDYVNDADTGILA